jgi:uncharacterized protein with von Willebrand factor type A (vWA) domain
MGAAKAWSREDEAPAAGKLAAANEDLVYQVQRWPRMLFKGEAQSGGSLSEAVGLRPDTGHWGAFCRELFGRLYGIGTKPLDKVREGAEWAGELHRQADAVPEWKDLEGRVQGDAWRAGLGAGVAASVLSQRLPAELPKEDLEALQAEADLLREFSEAQGGKRVSPKLLEQRANVQRRVKAAKAASAKALEQVQAAGGVPVRSAIREAAKAAGEFLEQMESGLDGLGCGTGAGADQRRAMAKQMVGNPRLREIAVLAGRLRTQARNKQRTKANRERDEVHGVTKGDDLQRLLASEVGLMVRAETRGILLSHLVDKRALQYELRGKTTKTRGPIIFCIDTSGSMSGHRDTWAKACALAMMEVARIQKRGFAVVFFNSSVAAEFLFDPARYEAERLLECLGYFSGGGTNIASALGRAGVLVADKTWRPGKDADVVLITDGDDRSDVETPAKALAEAGATLYTIAIEARAQAGLYKASREVVQIERRDMGGASQKLDAVFSV